MKDLHISEKNMKTLLRSAMDLEEARVFPDYATKNKDTNRTPFTSYDFADRAADSKYPSWKDAAPNLQTYLNAINKS